jgi:hypothetical protein
VGSRSDTIVFSYIGYQTKETVPGQKNVLAIVLEPEVRELEEIVVMAYTEKAKSEISSLVVSLSADKINDVTANSTFEKVIYFV